MNPRDRDIGISTRAAERGGMIVTTARGVVVFDQKPSFPSKNPIAIVILEDTTILELESPNMEGVDYFIGNPYTSDDKPILCNVSRIQVTGAVQLIYGE